MKNNKNIIKWFILGLFSTGLFIAGYIYSWEYRDPVLEVKILSLNRGRAVFVRTPENRTILIGGGQNSEVIREITKSMPFYSRKIDYVFISSAVPAQIGGLLEVVDRYDVQEIIMSRYIATSTVLTQLLRDVRKNKIHVEEVKEGDEIVIEDDLFIRVLFPNEDFKYNKTSLPELGLTLVYRDTSAYLLGNLSKTIQKYILKNTKANESKNIVEYYHSMTDTKTSAELLDFLDPQFIFSTKEKTLHIVSDGAGWERR